jgi:hypothetical protein
MILMKLSLAISKKIITTKPLYLERVDNWFLKLVLYYFNKYIFKNLLSTCLRYRGLSVFQKFAKQLKTFVN